MPSQHNIHHGPLRVSAPGADAQDREWNMHHFLDLYPAFDQPPIQQEVVAPSAGVLATAGSEISVEALNNTNSDAGNTST